jgi:hypothetical protein
MRGLSKVRFLKSNDCFGVSRPPRSGRMYQFADLSDSAKTQANFCDHFKPRTGVYTPPNTAEVDKAKAELEKLFGKK